MRDHATPRRILALFLPYLSTDRLARQRGRDDAGRPRVVVASQHGGMRLIAVDRRAEALGLTPGLPLADARAFLGPAASALEIAMADPAADAGVDQRQLHAVNCRLSELVSVQCRVCHSIAVSGTCA